MDFQKLISGVLFVSSLTLMTLVFFVLLSRGKNRDKLFFCLLIIVNSLWSISYYFWLVSTSQDIIFFWVGVLNVSATFIPVVFYSWVLTVLNKISERKIILIIGYLITFSFSLFSFSNLYFLGFQSIAGFRFWPIAGPLYIYYIIFLYFGFLILGISEIADSIKKSFDEKTKNKNKVVLGVFVLTLFAGSSNFPLWYGIEILPYGNFCLVFSFLILIVYAIFKYNLMDMKSLRIQLVLGLVLLISCVEIIFTDSLNELIFHIFNFLIFLFFSVLLIKSSNEEIKQTEHLRQVSGHLKKAIESLSITNRKLKELDKAKNEFLSVAAHQLRTPATAVKGYTAMILDGNFGKCDADVIGALKKVYQANERMTCLVEDLLNTSRIESGHLKYDFQKVNIQDILKELEYTFSIKVKDTKIQFSVEYPAEILPEIVADKNKTREVISNLIDNAIKYTIEGNVKVTLSKEEDNFVKILVEDTGRGMTEKTISNLFKKFSRGEESSSEVEGTGLGLFVVKKIVEKHGGIVFAESEGLGKGSKFTVKLPIEREESIEELNEEESEREAREIQEMKNETKDLI